MFHGFGTKFREFTSGLFIVPRFRIGKTAKPWKSWNRKTLMAQ